VRAHELLTQTTDYLKHHGVPEARLDAEVLLAHVLELERSDLYRDPCRQLSRGERGHYRRLTGRRARERVPVAYLVGEREFWSRRFVVTPDVLIPRPESEGLVELTVELARHSRIRNVLEIGVGSGALTGAIALELPEARFVALDRCRAALEIARRNLRRLGLSERVKLVQADAAAGLCGPFDLVLCNPPYIPTPELADLPPELHHEPILALDGGLDGLGFMRRIIRETPTLLARPGYLTLEVGAGQALAVGELLRRSGACSVESRRDLASVERIVLGCFGKA
jgi:release factor glutamine methyltransferase